MAPKYRLLYAIPFGAGLNVPQYYAPKRFVKGVMGMFDLLSQNGRGLYFGDFITPDHMRW